MSDDYRAKHNFTNEQIERFAEEFRARNNMENVDRVDIMKCFELGWIWTLKGNKKLSYIEVDDIVLGDRDAEATSDSTSAIIRVKRSVAQAARNFLNYGIDGYKGWRGIFTLAHELGHVVLCHEFGSRGRTTAGSEASKTEKVVEAFESTERHANVWAGAVLVGRLRLRISDTPETVSARFGVSPAAAKVRLDQVFKRKSAVVLKGFKELLDRLSYPQKKIEEKSVESMRSFATGGLKEISQSENSGLCTECGENTLCQDHGNNYSCRNPTCKARNIKLQDGDPF